MGCIIYRASCVLCIIQYFYLLCILLVFCIVTPWSGVSSHKELIGFGTGGCPAIDPAEFLGGTHSIVKI